MTTLTLVNIPVTPQGIEINNLSFLKSEQGKRATYQALCFGGVQSLLIKTSNYQKLLSLVDRMKEQGRTAEANRLEFSDRFLASKQHAEESAQRLAVIHSIASSSYDIELDFTATLQRGSSQEQIQKKADFAGVEAVLVKSIEEKAILRKYQEADAACDLAQALFYGADVIDRIQVEKDEFGYETGENEVLHSIYIRPEAVMKAFTRARDFLLSWNTPDWAELGVLKADIETLEKTVTRFEEVSEHAGEESRSMDEMAATSADLAAGNTA